MNARDEAQDTGGAEPETASRKLLASARGLVDRGDPGSRGLWPRAAVLLARQSIEVALKTYWSWAAMGMEECPARAQFLCLGRFLNDPALAGRAHEAWGALSRASHHHPYELAPTQDELHGWFDVAALVIDRTERGWRR